MIYAAMDLSWLNHLVADAELPEDATLLVIDRNGTVLLRYLDPGVWIGQARANHPLFHAMLAQGQGTAELQGVDGIGRIYAFTGL